MVIQKRATAGTLESNDTMVMIEPGNNDLEINIESIVLEQFGEDIRNTVNDMCNKLEVFKGKIFVKDRGALECTIKARVETALLRAGEINND